MTGSLAKCRIIFGHHKDDGISAAYLNRIYAPIDLDLGYTAPQEDAVRILAEVIAVRQKHGLAEGVIRTWRLPVGESTMSIREKLPLLPSSTWNGSY